MPVFKENEDRSNIDVWFWGSHGSVGLSINMSYGEGPVEYEVDEEIKKWLNNFEFRKALSLAIDPNKINEVMFLGQGTVSQGVFSKGHPFYPGDETAQKYTEHDPEMAKQILDSIGLVDTDGNGVRNRTDGKGDLVFITDYAAEYFVAFDVLAELIEEDLAKVGVKLALKGDGREPLQGAARRKHRHYDGRRSWRRTVAGPARPMVRIRKRVPHVVHGWAGMSTPRTP